MSLVLGECFTAYLAVANCATRSHCTVGYEMWEFIVRRSVWLNREDELLCSLRPGVLSINPLPGERHFCCCHDCLPTCPPFL